eukprot:scaffold197248_cov30-Tisochrysis_lutea.AAC.1
MRTFHRRDKQANHRSRPRRAHGSSDAQLSSPLEWGDLFLHLDLHHRGNGLARQCTGRKGDIHKARRMGQQHGSEQADALHRSLILALASEGGRALLAGICTVTRDAKQCMRRARKGRNKAHTEGAGGRRRLAATSSPHHVDLRHPRPLGHKEDAHRLHIGAASKGVARYDAHFPPLARATINLCRSRT